MVEGGSHLELDGDPGVGTRGPEGGHQHFHWQGDGPPALHPGEHDALELEVLAADGLHLVVGVQPGLELQVRDQLRVLVVGDVHHPVPGGGVVVVVVVVGVVEVVM